MTRTTDTYSPMILQEGEGRKGGRREGGGRERGRE